MYSSTSCWTVQYHSALGQFLKVFLSELIYNYTLLTELTKLISPSILIFGMRKTYSFKQFFDLLPGIKYFS